MGQSRGVHGDEEVGMAWSNGCLLLCRIVWIRPRRLVCYPILLYVGMSSLLLRKGWVMTNWGLCLCVLYCGELRLTPPLCRRVAVGEEDGKSPVRSSGTAGN